MVAPVEDSFIGVTAASAIFGVVTAASAIFGVVTLASRILAVVIALLATVGFG